MDDEVSQQENTENVCSAEYAKVLNIVPENAPRREVVKVVGKAHLLLQHGPHNLILQVKEKGLHHRDALSCMAHLPQGPIIWQNIDQ